MLAEIEKDARIPFCELKVDDVDMACRPFPCLHWQIFQFTKQ